MTRTSPSIGKGARAFSPCSLNTAKTEHSGFILLISILAIGFIASAILASLLMRGINAGTVSLSIQESKQALALAQGCAEYALLSLPKSPTYSGNEILPSATGTCEILTIGGVENNNRLLCTEGRSGDAVRRLEIVVRQILPQTNIDSWREVALFSLCK
jgi:hypothetical protein